MSYKGKEEIRIAGMVVTINRRLAEGGFGFVDLVTDVHNNKEYVVKKMTINL